MMRRTPDEIERDRELAARFTAELGRPVVIANHVAIEAAGGREPTVPGLIAAARQQRANRDAVLALWGWLPMLTRNGNRRSPAAWWNPRHCAPGVFARPLDRQTLFAFALHMMWLRREGPWA